MTSRLRHTALCALAAMALAAPGCGGDDEGKKLPPAVGQQLATTIAQIQARVAANVSGACDDVFDGAPGGNFDETAELIASIPEDVDPEIRSALSESVDRLQELVSTECDEIQAREAEKQETTSEETVPEETVPEETVPEETETETTPTETETTPQTPPGDKGNGQGPAGNGPPGQNGDGGGLEVPE